MHIFKAQNNIAFGYNQRINNIVNNKLKEDKKTPEIDNHLLHMNRLCMSTEDKLRNAEKNNNNELMGYYSNILTNIKPIVVNEIEDKYPELNFRKAECASYRNDARIRNITDESNWRYALLSNLEMNSELSTVTSKASDKPINVNEETNITPKKTTNIPPQTKEKPTESEQKGEDFLEKFIPSERSPKGFCDIGGLEELKEAFEETIIEPIMYPDMAELDKLEYGLTLPRGFLLYGPPGCGKTSVVEALSVESDLPLYKLRISKSGSHFINKSSNNLESVFDFLSKQYKETGKPSILFMDEVEALAPSRDSRNIGKEDIKMVSTLLPLIEDSRNRGIILVAATNCPDIVEDAVKYRLDRHEYIGLPDKENRDKILKVHLNSRKKGMALASNDKELDKVSSKTAGFSGRTLAILVDDAAKIARKDNRRNIYAQDFDEPISQHKDEIINEKKYKSIDKSKHNPIGFVNLYSQEQDK